MKLKFHTAFPVITLCLTLPAMAADITWDSGGSDDNWSTFDNWSDNATPVGDDVTFNNTGRAAGTTVTNIVDTSYTIDSLRFTHDNTANHTMSISSGQTLTVNGSFTPTNGQATAVMLSKPDGNNTATTNITGLGTFTVNNASNHFLVGFQNATAVSRVTLDMSELENFNATVNILGVGRKGTTDGTRQESGYLVLAKNSNVTATAITVGDSTGINGTANGGINNGSGSTLFLSAGGNRVNNLNANTMIFGRGKASGNMQFDTGAVSTDTVKLRATNGTGAVTDFIIADRNLSSTSGTPGGTVNFGAGKVDALITNLIVGRWGSAAATSQVNPSGTFTMGTNVDSSVTVTTLSLGISATTTNPETTRVVTGTLNVNGGVFSSTTVNLATGSVTPSLTKTANLNVDGGTFRFGSFGAPTGTNAVTINFNSGTVSSIDGTGRTLGLAYNLGKAGGGTTVAFGQATGGTGTVTLNGAGTLLGNTTVETVQNTTLGGALGGAFSLTKTGAALLNINQNQNYSGGTTVNAGILKMSGTRTLASGSNMTIGASGTWQLDGTSQTLGELSGSGLLTSTWANTGFDTLTVGSGDASSSFSGTIAGGNGTTVRGINLTKTGTGTLTLSGDNSYSGITNVDTGILRVSHANALGATGAAARTFIAGNDNTSRVELSGGITTGETFQIGMRQSPALDAPALSNLSGNNTVTGDINGVTGGSRINIESQADLLTLAGNLSQTSGADSRTWQLMGAGDGLVSGVISNGTATNLGIIKSGSGTWTFSNTNTYSGATNITGGTLAIGTGGSIANSSQVIVGANTTLDVSADAFTLGATAAQTLGGTGMINGNMTIGANGTLAIGTSPGTMTFNNNLGLNADSISNFEINSFTLGNYDLALAAAAGTQTVDFGGGTLNLLFQSGFSTEGTVKIFDFDAYTGSGFTSVVSTGLASGFTASFDASTGIVTVIPEPSAALLGGLGALVLLRRRR